MTCNECGEKPKKACGAFPKAVIEIDNPEQIVLIRKVLVPASMGDESTFPPTIGKYHNVLLEYEASGGIYLYSSDGIPTKLSSDVTELQAQLNALRVRVGQEEVARADADTALSNRITSLDDSLATVAKTGSYNDLTNKPTIGNATLTIKRNGTNVGTFTANATANKSIDIAVPTRTSDLTNDGSDGTSTYVEADELSTVATTGSYNDLTNKPTIPTVNNATLTIQKNGTNVQTFTANSSTNKTANITVPTAVSELTNDSGYATTTQLNNGLATKQDTLTAGDNIQINGNTISATDTTYTAGNAIDITNGEISADIHPADFFTAEDTVSDCGRGLSLDGTIASTLESVELKGDTSQQTYSGKNLFNSYALADKTFFPASCRMNIGADGTITLTDNTSTNGYCRAMDTPLRDFCPKLEVGRTYYLYLVGENLARNLVYLSNSGFSWVPGASRTITQSDLDGDIVFYGGYNTTTTIKIMITETQDNNYEPYVGGYASPSPEYPQDIQVVTGEQTVTVTGKNLLDISSLSQAAINVGQVVENGLLSDTSSNDDSRYWGYANRNWTITLSPGVYTLSETFTKRCTNVSIGALKVYTSSGALLVNNYGIADKDHVADTFTLTETTTIGIMIKIADGECYVQLEKGANATAYEPYHNQSYAIDLGTTELCKIGDYQDYIYKSGDDWYVHKAMGKITLDGSETWSAAQMTNNWMYYTINAGMAVVTSSQMPNIISNYFSVTTTDGQWTSVAGSKSVTLNNAVSPNTQIRFTVGDSTNKLADFKTWLSTHNTTVYYALATPDNILIENPVLVAQLNALAKAKSYNDQTNIIVTAAGDNLPATLCVEAYRKSLSGVIEAIDNACTCRKNLVVYLPNGMTTYTNNDAPIPIPEVVEAFKRGQSVFLIDDALPERIYTVTAADMDDGIYSMRADQTGINSRVHDGYWHISGGGDVWDQVEFIQDDTPYPYRMLDYDASIATWQAFGSRAGDVYFPASEDVTFMPPSGGGSASVASLWEKMNSGEEIRLRIPLQAISDASASLVEEGYFKVNPMREITVELGPQHYYDYDNGVSGENNRKVQGYMVWSTSYVPGAGTEGPDDFLVGIVKVTQGGTSHYVFVTSLKQDRLN